MSVSPPDLELWLTGYVRAKAADAGLVLDVDNKEPETLTVPLTKPLIVVRDDGGPRLDWTTFDRSVGASVLAGSRMDVQPAVDISRWLAGLLFDDAIVLVEGTPIAAVRWDSCNGPYAVPDVLDVARRYLTAGYTVSGSW